jgi:diacylglycerol O-acyltransferase / wax synthase
MLSWASRTAIRPLAPRDAEFVYNESGTHAGHLMVSYFFDADQGECSEVSWEQAVEWITERLGYADLFTTRLQRTPFDLDYPRWVPAGILDMHRHVTVQRVGAGGWAPVRAYLGGLLAQKLDLTRPPWELHVLCGVHGLDDLTGRHTVVTLKIHHSAVDGLAARDLTQALFSTTTKPSRSTAPSPMNRASQLSRALYVFPGTMSRFIRGLSATREAAAEVREAEESGELVPVRDDLGATRFNRSLYGEISVDFMILPIERARAIQATVPGASLNDVYLTVVSGALAAYLESCGERPGNTLCAMVPRSMRRIMHWESANQLAILTIDLNVDEADPLLRLAKITAAAAAAKQRSEHTAVRRKGTRVETSPSWLLRLTGFAVRHYPHDTDRGRQSHTTVSNIPVTMNGCTFSGAPAKAVLGGQPPVDGDTLRHYLLAGADGDLILNVFSSSASMPDSGTYLTCLRHSLAELSRAAEFAENRTS